MLMSVLLTLGIWHRLDPRGVAIFAAFWVLGELLSFLTWRLSLNCPQCGFDPMLYKRSPAQASQKVRHFYEQRTARADFLLTGRALIETQRRIQEGRRTRQASRDKGVIFARADHHPDV